jgi:hypothetical protein
MLKDPATGLRVCECPVPNPRITPGRENFCVECSFYIKPAWTCNNATIDGWLDRLEAALPGEDLEAFREHIVVRELAGRDRFRHSFLGRNNCDEGLEEAVDLALYSLLDTLRAKREGRGDEDIDLALTAAAHAFHAHSALRRLKAKRAGAP